MDRLKRSVAYVALGLLPAGAGCRSPRSEVPPARQSLFSRLGQEGQPKAGAPGESTVNFHQEPRQAVSPPYGGYTPNASGLATNPQVGLNPNGLSGTPGGAGGGNLGLLSDAGVSPTSGGLGANPSPGGGTNPGSFAGDPGFGPSGTAAGGSLQPASRWPSQSVPPSSGAGINPSADLGVGAGALPTPGSGAPPAAGSLSTDAVPVINQNPAVNPAASPR